MPPTATRHMTQPGKVLVMGDDTRSFLATVRSLGRKGIEVHVAPFNMRAPALSSKYIRQVHLLPYYLDGGADWLAAMQKLMLLEHFELIIPCEERTLLPLYKHQHELPGTCKLAIPSQRALEAFFDKTNTRQLAASLGVPVAKGRPLLATDTADSVLAELTLPIVAKQRQSYSWPDLYVRTSVKRINTREALAQWIATNSAQSNDAFFEETLPGFGLGVSVLCHNGHVLQAFEHHRAHELMGSSFYRKSMPVHAARLAGVQRMVATIGYTGLAMFEFKQDNATGRWGLLEVNARPWGSLPLPVAIGVDFPYQLYQLLVCKKIVPSASYKQGVYARNLIADLWQAREVAQKLWPSKWATVSYLVQWLAGFGRVLLGKEHHDAFTWADPAPAWAEIKQLVADKLDAINPRSSASHLQLPERALHLLKNNPRAHIVFVCQGNICRSPYAENKARQLLAASHPGLRFSSAGLLPRNRRPSPAQALQAGAAQGVDLLPHQSSYLSEQLLEQADLIVIFDLINLTHFKARYPESRKPIVLIGSFQADGNGINIVKDPEGQAVPSFIATYQQIDIHLNQLAKSLV